MIAKEIKPSLFDTTSLWGLAMGLFPALYVTTTVYNALGIAIPVMLVMICTNFVISMTRSVIPYKIRILYYTIIIATFSSCFNILMNAYAPYISQELGIFIPLIAVNCIIMGRAEAFASKNRIGASVVDAIVNGLAFGSILILCSLIREPLGSNSLFGFELVHGLPPIRFFAYTCGGFFTIAIILAVINYTKSTKENRK